MSRWISALAPTSIPRVGSSSSRSFGLVASQRASSTFCWLPPERLPASMSGFGGPDLQQRDVLLDDLVRASLGHPAQPATLGLDAQHDVLADGEVADDALGLAALRRVDDLVGHRDAGRPDPNRLARDQQLTAVGVVGAVDQAGELRASGAQQACETDDLTRVDVQVDGFQCAPAADADRAEVGDRLGPVRDQGGRASDQLLEGLQGPSDHLLRPGRRGAARR